LRGAYSSEPFVLGLFASLATLGFISQPFVMKENLLTHSPGEGFVAIDAGYRTVLKVRLDVVRFCYRINVICCRHSGFLPMRDF